MDFNLQNPPTTPAAPTTGALSTVSPFQMHGQIRANDDIINSNEKTENSEHLAAISPSSVSLPEPNFPHLPNVRSTSADGGGYATSHPESRSEENVQVAKMTSNADYTKKISANYNLRSPAVKRLLREAYELSREPNHDFRAVPLEDNLFEWHFTIRGPADSEFAQGIYHGRIIMPPEYPMKPPSIMILTPNGRFETSVKICLSISSYHPETWRPSWSIRTALMALISFMATPSPGAIGSLECSADARRSLARKSIAWVCPTCGPIINDITHATQTDSVPSASCTSTLAAPRPFRLPHPHSDEALHDEVVLPEDIPRGPVPDYVTNHPFNNQGGDSGVVENADLNFGEAYYPLGPVPENAFSYALVVGTLVIAILGLVLRRIYSNSSDDP